MKTAESSWIHDVSLPKSYRSFSLATRQSSESGYKRQSQIKCPRVHRLVIETLLTENNNNQVIIFIIPKNKFVRRTAVAFGGDTAVSLLNIFMVCITARIKSMDHRNWKNIAPRIPASELSRNYF